MVNSAKKQSSIIAIITMMFLFAMIAFVTNLCSPMAIIVKNQFGASNFLAQVGNYGNFMAYLVMGIPAGTLILRVGGSSMPAAMSTREARLTVVIMPLVET